MDVEILKKNNNIRKETSNARDEKYYNIKDI